MKNVLFLCTGNSCRSQLAEAIINRELDGSWKAYSAGIEPEKEVNHFTLDALSEVGIDHSVSRPKHFTEFEGIEFDVVITLSERAALECPLWTEIGVRHHFPIVDPAPTGDLNAYRAVREEIKVKIVPFLDTFGVQCTG